MNENTETNENMEIKLGWKLLLQLPNGTLRSFNQASAAWSNCPSTRSVEYQYNVAAYPMLETPLFVFKTRKAARAFQKIHAPHLTWLNSRDDKRCHGLKHVIRRCTYEPVKEEDHDKWEQHFTKLQSYPDGTDLAVSVTIMKGKV